VNVGVNGAGSGEIVGGIAPSGVGSEGEARDPRPEVDGVPVRGGVTRDIPVAKEGAVVEEAATNHVQKEEVELRWRWSGGSRARVASGGTWAMVGVGK
jgi:hypothetical protein